MRSFPRQLILVHSAPRGRSLQQIPWTTYFQRELFLHDPSSPTDPTIHAYLTSPVGKGPLFIMHHGAGSSGLSFALVGDEIRKRLPSAGILSLDARGHGLTTTPPDNRAIGLSLEVFAADLLSAILLTQKEMKWSELPPIILVGHSLGGAVVTEVAKTGKLSSSLLGYVVLDVVEGSAVDALKSMNTYLSTRPTGFTTLEEGIDWHLKSRTIRNSLSARTSVPSLLKLSGAPGDPRPWKWRTDLGATEPFWENWFTGLSQKFLSARGGKLLLLAGTDRLDTELTIGQMQGSCPPWLIRVRRGCTELTCFLRQGNMPCRYFPRQDISYMKTYPKRSRYLSWTSTSVTIGLRWCYPRKCLIYSNKVRKSSWRFVNKKGR